MARHCTPKTTNKPLLLALLLLLSAAATIVDAFIIATRPSRFSRPAITRVGATASFLPGAEGSSSSGSGPLASVPTLGSLGELERATKATGARPLVVRFHASWCSACKKFAPLWLETAGAYAPSGFEFVDVDVTNQRDVITAMGLTVLPHCHIYAHGERQESLPVSVKKLNDLLEKLEQLKESSSFSSSS